jgi:hypothetical protein
MRRAARREFEEKYTAERNYGQLLSLYNGLVVRKEFGSQSARLRAVAAGGAQ